MEKRCSNCGLAREFKVKSVKETGIVIEKGGVVLNDSTFRETFLGFVLHRGCERGQGTETIKSFDKCIHKLEFGRKP